MNALNQSLGETVNALEVFTFNYSESKNPVRTLLVDGEVFFVGSDVAKTLGYKEPHKAITRHCRYGMKRTIPHPQNTDKSLQVLTIPEGDVFRLIISSELPSAQAFESWVMDELLPTLRKKGYYVMQAAKKQVYVDFRHNLHHRREFLGKDVRFVEYENDEWFSINDLHQAIGSTTKSGQTAKVLNLHKVLAQKFWLAGNTHPAWFCNHHGAQLILNGSKKAKESMRINFKINA